MTTAWMWLDDYKLHGLTIDLENGTMRWHDAVGCHCADEEYFDQPITDYKQNGPPPMIGLIPEDIEQEITLTITAAGFTP